MIRPATKKKILYIDAHPVCHLGLHRILSQQLPYELSRCAESVDEIPKKPKPDLVILDLSAARGKGISSIKEIRSALPDSPVLVLTSHQESLFAERCLKAGATGYVMKSASPEVLLDALESTSKGELYVTPQVRALMLQRLSNSSPNDLYSGFDRLSDRELLVVEQIGLSKNNKEIAKELQISVKTIESHRSRIKAKLRLNSPQELMRYAMRLHRP